MRIPSTQQRSHRHAQQVLGSPEGVFTLHLAMLREASISRIAGSRFHIGRHPLFGKLDQFALVLDLTAEFPSPRAGSYTYHCMANLDGVALTDLRVPPIPATGDVLIHCAQGHGRSAVYAALLLAGCTADLSAEQALRIIQRSRPGARPSSAQLSQLRAVDAARAASSG